MNLPLDSDLDFFNDVHQLLFLLLLRSLKLRLYLLLYRSVKFFWFWFFFCKLSLILSIVKCKLFLTVLLQKTLKFLINLTLTLNAACNYVTYSKVIIKKWIGLVLICCCPFLFPFFQILPSKSFLSDAHISKGCQNKHTSCFHISTLCDWSMQRENKRQIISWCRGHLFPFAQHWFCSSMMTSLLNSSKGETQPTLLLLLHKDWSPFCSTKELLSIYTCLLVDQYMT